MSACWMSLIKGDLNAILFGPVVALDQGVLRTQTSLFNRGFNREQ
jgi:hypothetical protein